MNYEIQEAPEQTFAVIKRTVAFLRHPEGDAGVGGDRPELGGHDAARPTSGRTKACRASTRSSTGQLQRDGHTETGEPIEIYETHDPVPETRIIWPVG